MPERQRNSRGTLAINVPCDRMRVFVQPLGSSGIRMPEADHTQIQQTDRLRIITGAMTNSSTTVHHTRKASKPS